MSEAVSRMRKTVVERVLHGAGKTTGIERRAAFDNRDVPAAARALIEKVARNAWKVTDEDIAAVKAAGLSDDQIYELVICGALGQSMRQLDSARAALDLATEKTP